MQSTEELLARVEADVLRGQDSILPVYLTLPSVACMVTALQLSLRHPGFCRAECAQAVAHVIQCAIARVEREGFNAMADLLRLGNNSARRH